MYNKYTYDFSKPTAMNINPNLADCFEQTDVSSVDINKILNDINSKFIEQMEEKVEAPTRSTTSSTTSSTTFKPRTFTTTFKKYKL
jgi:hypothetical protein